MWVASNLLVSGVTIFGVGYFADMNRAHLDLLLFIGRSFLVVGIIIALVSLLQKRRTQRERVSTDGFPTLDEYRRPTPNMCDTCDSPHPDD